MVFIDVGFASWPENSVHVKYKIFLSAMEYLPLSPEDDSKGSFEEIVERYLSVLRH